MLTPEEIIDAMSHQRAVDNPQKVEQPEKVLEECPNCHQESLIVVGGGQGCMMCSHTFSYTQ